MTDFSTMAEALYGTEKASPENATVITTGSVPSKTNPAPPRPVDPAAVLYGGPDRPTAAPVERRDESDTERNERLADALFNEDDTPAPDLDIPDHIKEMRDADTGRKLYDPVKTFQVVIPDNALAELEIPPPLQKAVIHEWRHMAADLGMTSDDLLTFKDVVARFEKPTPEMRANWHDEAVDALNREYGDGAKAALRDAMKLAQRDPRMAKMLDEGMGDHPKIILQFARLARQARNAGRLK